MSFNRLNRNSIKHIVIMRWLGRLIVVVVVLSVVGGVFAKGKIVVGHEARRSLPVSVGLSG